MGEMAVTKSPRDVLTIVGLGSCVALILVAPRQRAAALAHVVLPESKMTGGREAPPAKFADTAVPAMLSGLLSLGVRPDDLYAVLVGGATMFGSAAGSKLAGVGDRNVEAASALLMDAGIAVTGKDVGGEHGRSVQVVVGESRVMVKSGTDEAVELGAPPLGGSGQAGERGRVATARLAEGSWGEPASDRMTA